MRATRKQTLAVSGNDVELLQSLIEHPDLTISTDYILELRRLEAGADQTPIWYFDFKECFLPPNSIFPSVQKLIDHPNLVIAAVLAVQEYLLRCKNSKSRTARFRFTLQIILQFIEYLWLSNITELRQTSEKVVRIIPVLLAENGWWRVLKINERLRRLPDLWLEDFLLRKSRLEWGATALQSELQEALGTVMHNVYAYYNQGLTENSESDPKERQLAARTITHSLNAINCLYDIGDDYGLTFIPFPKPELIAKKFGRPASRTENLPVDVAAKLLSEAGKWIGDYGPKVADLLDLISDEVVECRSLNRIYMGKRMRIFFSELDAREISTKNFPFPIEYLDFGRKSERGKNSLRNALLCTITACFVMIASMNARRRDEILHRKYGLRSGDLRLVNKKLSLYEVDFYVEKTYQTRIPFYVNKITVDAIRLLERIEAAFHKIDCAVPPKTGQMPILVERSLFAYRRFSWMKGVGNERKWYGFASYSHDGDASQFIELALGEKRSFSLGSHMFRRMYALIFFYQYENPDLLALSHQLGHFGLSSTLIYVTDPASRSEAERIKNTLYLNRENARKDHNALIESDLRKVGYEKHLEDVFAVISGGAYAGGYVKYIRRLHTRLTKIVSFNVANRDGAEAVVKALKQRGHFPRPMKHGQCMSGATLQSKLARCSAPGENKVRRENAEPLTCATCIYHLTSPAYLENMKREAVNLELRLADARPPTLQGDALKSDLGNLNKAISLMKIRLDNL